MKIQAHRGASCERPENTLSAFRRAVKLGADGIELDVHKVADGSIIVFHDTNLKRCIGVDRNIYELTGEQIRAYNFRAVYGSSYKHEHVPYLFEVLNLLSDKDIFINVEIKANSTDSQIEFDVLQILYDYRIESRCMISSFNHDILKSIKKIDSAIKVGALYHSAYTWSPAQYAVEHGFDAMHPQFESITPEMVAECHTKGILVNAYTVDRPSDMKRMMEYGVDSIITNDVAIAKKL